MLDSTIGLERSGAKTYPESLEKKNARLIGLPKKWRAIDRLRCLAAVVLLEMLEEESNGVTKSGKHPRGTHEASINSESLLLKQIPAKSA